MPSDSPTPDSPHCPQEADAPIAWARLKREDLNSGSPAVLAVSAPRTARPATYLVDAIRELQVSGQSIFTMAEDYMHKLEVHDWFFEWSDDKRTYDLGKAERQKLKRLRGIVDADGRVWNIVAPTDFHWKG